MKPVTASAGTRRPHAHAVESEAARRERLRTEDAARQKTLYGSRADDAHVLRTRGFTVVAEGRDRFRVGNELIDGAALTAKADRERRLMGAAAEVRRPTETATGLRIGEAVPIEAPRRRAARTPIAHGTLFPEAATAVAGRSAPSAASSRPLSGAAAKAKSIAAEHSTDLGARPHVVWLDLDLLTVDRRYQREIGQAGAAHINRIAREFNWNRYQPIVVSEGEGGRYAVIDGQHRLEAARKHPLVRELPCYIIDAPDVAAQAAIFVSVNSRRLALTGLQKFWADFAAGNKEATAVHRICHDAGVTILRRTPSGDIPAGSVYSALTLQRLVLRLGRARVATAVALLAETHGDTPNAFRAPTVRALATIAGDPVFSRTHTCAALRALDLDRLYEDARLDRIAAGGTLETATERVLRRHFARSTEAA